MNLETSTSTDLPVTAPQGSDEGKAQENPNPFAWLLDPKECRTTIKRLAARAYPSYRGRTFRVEYSETYRMQNYWDGGTRHYCMGVDLTTERVFAPHADTTSPFNAIAGSEFAIPPGFAILELCIFQGRNMGISLILSSRNAKGKASV